MATIIKAHGRTPGVTEPQASAFNFDDISDRADDYLQSVRQQAARIVAEAQAQAEEIRRQAQQDGHQAARAAAHQVLDEKIAQQMKTLLPALRSVVADVQHARQGLLSHWEGSAVHVAAAMAARVIRRQLPHMPEVPLTLVREALELAAGSPQIRIRLHPADHAALVAQVELLAKELAPLGPVEVVADESITAGGCRIETQFGQIDQQIETQLRRLEEELADPPEE